MMKKIIILLTLILCCISQNSVAQKFDYRVKAGFNIGGTAPVPIPAEIRKITGYSPSLSLLVGADVIYHIDDKWGVMSGLKFETKGMTAKARVKNYQIDLTVSEGDETGSMSGVFTGRVKTKVKNEYLTLPLVAVYKLSSRWEVNGGLFASILLDGGFDGNANNGYLRNENPIGEKVNIEKANFDFSSDVRKFNWGAQIGASWKAYKQFSVIGDLSWGFNGIFSKDFDGIGFDMYNIYLNLGFAYTF